MKAVTDVHSFFQEESHNVAKFSCLNVGLNEVRQVFSSPGKNGFVLNRYC
jgi:hypothetical protein